MKKIDIFNHIWPEKFYKKVQQIDYFQQFFA